MRVIGSAERTIEGSAGIAAGRPIGSPDQSPLGLVGFVGPIVDRDLLIPWAFLTAFGLAEIARDLWRKWRARPQAQGRL